MPVTNFDFIYNAVIPAKLLEVLVKHFEALHEKTKTLVLQVS